jgi:hypothetical protein
MKKRDKKEKIKEIEREGEGERGGREIKRDMIVCCH